MTVEDLIDICRQFSALGWAVRDQLVEAVNGSDLTKLNPNALKLCVGFLDEAAELGVDGTEDLANRIKAHLSSKVCQ